MCDQTTDDYIERTENLLSEYKAENKQLREALEELMLLTKREHNVYEVREQIKQALMQQPDVSGAKNVRD